MFGAQTEVLRMKGENVKQIAEDFARNVSDMYRAVYEMGSSSYRSSESSTMVMDIDTYRPDLDKMTRIIYQYGAFCQSTSKTVINNSENIKDMVRTGGNVSGAAVSSMDEGAPSTGSYSDFGAYQANNPNVAMSYEKTIANANTIEKCSNTMNSIFNNFSEMMNQVANGSGDPSEVALVGQAAVALKTRFDALKGRFDEYVEKVKKFSTMITSAANATQATDKNLAQGVDQIINQ